MRARTKAFANRIIKLYLALPQVGLGGVLGKQLLRSGTSVVGANYRAACRGRSRSEFAAKIGIVIEEVDETIYWLELLEDNNVVPQHRLESLLREANELTSIFVATRKSTRAKKITNLKSQI